MKRSLCLLLTVTMLFGMLTSCLPVGARHEETETTTDAPTTTDPDDGKPELFCEIPIHSEDDPYCCYQIESEEKYLTNFDDLSDQEIQAYFDDGYKICVTFVFDYPCIDRFQLPLTNKREIMITYYDTNSMQYADKLGLLDRYYYNSEFKLIFTGASHDAWLNFYDFETYKNEEEFLKTVAKDPCIRYIILSLEKWTAEELSVQNFNPVLV